MNLAEIKTEVAEEKLEESEEKLKDAERMLGKALRAKMTSEDNLVIMSLALERNFDPFAVLWWWEAVICTIGPLVIMSIFVGGAWYKSYTQNVIKREKLSKIILKRANPKELVSKIAQISISNYCANSSVEVRGEQVTLLEKQEPDEEANSVQFIPSPF